RSADRAQECCICDAVTPHEAANPKRAEGVPTLVAEVLSANDRVGNVTRRSGEFLRAGVRLIWIIDPEARDVTVHRPGHPSEVFEGDEELTGHDVLPDLRCRAADFFFVAGAGPT